MGHIRDTLASKPSYEELIRCLTTWTAEPVLCKVSVEDGLIARTVVYDILPHFWPLCKDDQKLEALLVKALSSLAGINALLANLADLACLTLLQLVISSENLSLETVYRSWFGADAAEDERSKLAKYSTQLWSQYITLFAGGKILGSAAQAALLHKTSLSQDIWIHDLSKYTNYLGEQLASVCRSEIELDHSAILSMSNFLNRAMSLGQRSVFVNIIAMRIVDSTKALTTLCQILAGTSSTVQANFTADFLFYLQSRYLGVASDRNHSIGLQQDTDRVGAAAFVVSIFIAHKSLSGCLRNLIVSQASPYALATHRSIVLSFSTHEPSQLGSLADDCIAIWSDSLYIKHAPIVAQESLTETILLLCAYLAIQDLTRLSKASVFMEGISNRLGSTTDRIRFLGMILGEAVSAQVIADEKKRLTFGVPDTQTPEALWWKSLIEIEDRIGTLAGLEAGLIEVPVEGAAPTTLPLPSEEELKIMELIEEELFDEEDDEFKPMRIPDSDDEDSEDDPTLIDREKVATPVYIRDLIKIMENHESYKHILKGLQTAPTLIRRKAGFGTEVADYAIKLAQIFSGLQDNFDMDDFQELRQEALKALVVACPKVACPYLAITFFTGDYSLQQRTIILSAIGLGSRELAGAIEVAPQFENLFVSKRLPAAKATLYLEMQNLAASEQQKILQPMAVDAVESLSGPAALRVNRITKRSAKLDAVPHTKKPNLLAPIVAESIFFPLLGNFAVRGGKLIDRDATTFYESNLLGYYLRTLALTYQVSFTSPSFHRMTQEFLSLILSLRTQDDHTVLEALLFSLLVVIDTNDPRSLCLEFSRPLIEAQDWCAVILDAVKEEKIQVLAAGLLIRIKEMVDRHQALMVQGVYSLGSIGRGKFGIAGLK